jgi:dienelactone hydrolase
MIRAMHWLDRLSASALGRTPPHRRVFRDGWGDRDLIDAYLGRVATFPPLEIPLVSEHPPRLNGEMVVTEFDFESTAEDLPERSRTARARLIAAAPEAEQVVLLMSAWNDHDYRSRTRIAMLLLAHGIASVMLENPYYGERRPSPGDEQPIATVADFGMMGRAAVLDGRALAGYFHRRGAAVGVSGFSMGGNLAAFVAAGLPFPVAAAPLAGAHSPAPVFLDGILRSSIAWDALGGEDPDVERALWDYLSAATVLDHPPRPHLRNAVLLAATKDGYVPTSAVQAVHRHWPGSTLEWINAGHGSLAWRHRSRMAEAIVRSFDRMAAGPTDTSGAAQ